MSQPMYRQIAEDLRRNIEAGELAPGIQLPTETELRDKYGASRNTVRDAIRWLATRGLVVTRPGQGTFIVEKIDPVIIRLGAETEETAGGQRFESSLPMVELQIADTSITHKLGLSEGSRIVSRHHRKFLSSIPWSLQTSFYPMQLVEMGATRLLAPDEILPGALQYFREALGIKQVAWNESLAVRPPSPLEAEFFDLPLDGRIQVFETIRTAYDELDRPLRLKVSVYPADRNQFVVTAGQVPAAASWTAEIPDAVKAPMVEARTVAVVALER